MNARAHTLTSALSHGERETFSLVLSTVTPAAELQGWFEAAPAWPAKAGEAVYAAGVMLPRGEAAVQLVARWVAEKRADAHQVRDPDEPRRWLFICRKLAGPAAPLLEAGSRSQTASEVPSAGAGSAVRLAPLARTADRSELTELLAALRRAAERGEPCPSNAALARLLDLPGRSAAEREKSRLKIKDLMRRLERENRIAIECRGTALPRIVTILAPGRGCGKATSQ